MVRPHHGQDLIQHVADLDIAERERPALDPEHQMLHLERKDLGLDDRLGAPAPLHHQVPRAVPVKLGDGLEQIEEVGPVGLVEFGDQAGVDEDELRAVALAVDGVERRLPVRGAVAVGPQALEDVLGDVDGLVGVVGCAVAAEGEGELGGLVEAHHDVARVQVGVDEVVEEEHAQEGVEAFVGDFLLEDAAAGFEEGFEGDAGGEFFDQDLPRRVFDVRVGEPGGGAVFEVFAEDGEVGGFDAEVELEAHHFAELGDFVGEREPFDGWDGVEHGGEKAHDSKVPSHHSLYFGVQDLDRNVGRWHTRRRTFDEDIDVLPDTLAHIFGSLDIRISRSC